MSSGDDSETAEWEREQMLRGTQSRRHNAPQKRAEKGKDTVDVALARGYVNQDIERVQATIESIKRSMGSTWLEMAKREKRIQDLRNHIRKLESFYSLFGELSSLSNPEDVLSFIAKNKSVISNLAHDQQEMISSLEERLKTLERAMDVD